MMLAIDIDLCSAWRHDTSTNDDACANPSNKRWSDVVRDDRGVGASVTKKI